MFTPRHTRKRSSDGSIAVQHGRYRRVALSLLAPASDGRTFLRPAPVIGALFAPAHGAHPSPLRAVRVEARSCQHEAGRQSAKAPSVPESLRQLRVAVWQSLPDTAYWSRLAHSVSVTGVMAGIAFGLWAAPTLAHWNTDPGLQSATLSIPARTTPRQTHTEHWMRVADRNASSVAPSPLPHDAPTAAPEHDFAVPRGDLRKDISDANRDAGPRTGFGGH